MVLTCRARPRNLPPSEWMWLSQSDSVEITCEEKTSKIKNADITPDFTQKELQRAMWLSQSDSVEITCAKEWRVPGAGFF